MVEFADEARRFCAFIEGCGELPLAERLHATRDRLVALYLVGCRLEDPGECEEVEPTRRAPLHVPSFEPVDHYLELFDPFEEQDLVGGSISGELGEIYRVAS